MPEQGNFVDVTRASPLKERAWGMGPPGTHLLNDQREGTLLFGLREPQAVLNNKRPPSGGPGYLPNKHTHAAIGDPSSTGRNL
jgi:hypothetical protein